MYTLWSFNRIFFGNLSVFSLSAYSDLSRKEIALFLAPIISLFIRGLAPYLFLDVFFSDCINLLEHARLGLI